MDNSEIRLNKYIAMCGVCSRRDADKYIEKGLVKVNGKVALQGTKVKNGDKVEVDGKKINMITEKKVYAYYKPVGVACTKRDPHAQKTVATEVKTKVPVTYAGRLDVASEGLLILTNDGDLINAMMKSSNEHEKEYVVKVDKDINGSFLNIISHGVYLEDLGITTKACKVTKTGKNQFRIILTQGLNRQIRRMCKSQGYNVVSLKRTRVVNIKLGDMKKGQVREITGSELYKLYNLCGLKY